MDVSENVIPKSSAVEHQLFTKSAIVAAFTSRADVACLRAPKLSQLRFCLQVIGRRLHGELEDHQVV